MLLRELARFSLIEWNSNDAALFSMHRLVQQVQLDVILLDDAELETTEATMSERMAGACVRVVNCGLAKGDQESQAEGWAVGMNTTNRWLLHALYMHESYAWLCESTMKEVGKLLAWVGVYWLALTKDRLSPTVVPFAPILPSNSLMEPKLVLRAMLSRVWSFCSISN